MTAAILPSLEVANQPLFMSASFSFEASNTVRKENENKSQMKFSNVENKRSPEISTSEPK